MANATRALISASSCMGYGPSMSMAIHRTAVPPRGSRRAWRCRARKDFYPNDGLARHEWQKHGTCSGKSPTDYFADVRRARDLIVIPAPFVAAKEKQTWTPIDIARAFIAANSRLRPGMLGVTCTSGVLQEVRICLSKDLRDFHACPEVSRQGCRVREITVPPIL